MGDPAAEKPPETVGAPDRAKCRVPSEGIRAVPPQAQVDMAARSRAVVRELRHERDRQPRLLGDLLEALLEDHMAVCHVEPFRIPHVQLVLPETPFTL